MYPWGWGYWKIHKKLFSGTPFNFTYFVISPKLQRIWCWNFGFATRKIWAFIWYQKMTTSGWALGDENVIGIRSLKILKWGHFHIFSLSYNLTSDDLWPWYITFAWTYEGTKFGSNRTSTFQMRPFSHIQAILQLDLKWPLTLICDLWPQQQMRVPILHLWPNFGWNPSKHVEVRAKC